MPNLNSSSALIIKPAQIGYYCLNNPNVVQVAAGLALLSGTISLPTAIALVSCVSKASTTMKIVQSTAMAFYYAGPTISRILKVAESYSHANVYQDLNARYKIEIIKDNIVITDSHDNTEDDINDFVVLSEEPDSKLTL